jgi:hypothetical protein
MFRLPILYFLPAVLSLWLAARFRVLLRTRRPLQDDEQADFGVIHAATLTLLALIIGFSVSMATSRYDLRKSYKEAGANAIGAELGACGFAASRRRREKYTVCFGCISICVSLSIGPAM